MTPLFVVEVLSVLALSAGVGVLGHRMIRRRAAALMTAALAAGWLVLDVAVLRHSAVFARVVPWTDVVVLGNLAPAAVALLIAMLFRLRSGSVWYSLVLAVALGGTGVWHSYRWLFDPSPPIAGRWKGDVCMQTSGATCSPAAAATLLSIHCIPTTEAEMARLCLTTTDGTSQLGLYRGMCLKTRGTPWTVELVGGDADRACAAAPAVAAVGVGWFQDVDPRYSKQWSWSPGVLHTVVLFGSVPGGERVDVADPAVGREQWTRENLGVLWKGVAFRLVRG